MNTQNIIHKILIVVIVTLIWIWTILASLLYYRSRLITNYIRPLICIGQDVGVIKRKLGKEDASVFELKSETKEIEFYETIVFGIKRFAVNKETNKIEKIEYE